MASGADDVLGDVVVHERLGDAVDDCVLVIGTSARPRSIAWPVLTPRACALNIAQISAGGLVAVVFGREHSGLSNEEIDFCHQVIQIPTAENFSSLNLGAAVQVVAYEIRQAFLGDIGMPDVLAAELASAGQMGDLFAHLQQTMIEVGFFDPEKPRRLQRRIKRMFNRAALDKSEVQILRGFLTAVCDKPKPRS